MFVFDVLEQRFQVHHPVIAHGIVELDALVLHVYDSTDPVHAALVDGKDDLVKIENAFA
jgi:hypothetical protein